MGYPQFIHFNRIFQYKPSSYSGAPMSMDPPSHTLSLYIILYKLYTYIYMYTIYTYMYWLVVYLPLWKNMTSSVGIMTFRTEWKVIKAMFQPTNQCVYIYNAYNLSPYIIYIHYHLSPYIYIYIIYIHYIHIHTLSYIMEQQNSCLNPPTSIYISYIYYTYIH